MTGDYWPYQDTAERFKEMTLGQVNKKCKAFMFHMINKGDAFNAMDCFITDICDHLVEQLHLAT